jgi:hypothetical protein
MEYLGNSILDRCVRVLQARDEVGFQFYKRQDNSTRDAMLYHFDYLTRCFPAFLTHKLESRVTYTVWQTYQSGGLASEMQSFAKPYGQQVARVLATC